MDKTLKAKWVEALLSGKFEQCSGVFCTNDGAYCAVGLLMHLDTGFDTFSAMGATPTGRLSELLGGDEACQAFFEMNDAGVPFEMQAGLIEEAFS